MRSDRDKALLERSFRPRRRRRLPRLAPAFFILAVLGGLGALWVGVFSEIFTDPGEWHLKQRRFDRVIREITRHSGPGEEGSSLPPWPAPLGDDQVALIACADAQIIRGVRHSATYHSVHYPWGDIPEHLGTAPDLIIRCVRAMGVDLQQMVHIDRRSRPRKYPLRLWASRRPDRSIDHRRLPNLFTFFKTFGESRPLTVGDPTSAAEFLPGDIVFWNKGGQQGFPGLVGIVTTVRDADGTPRAVTLLAGDRRVTGYHAVDQWTVAGHFRVRGDLLIERFLEVHPDAVLRPRPAGDE